MYAVQAQFAGALTVNAPEPPFTPGEADDGENEMAQSENLMKKPSCVPLNAPPGIELAILFDSVTPVM